MHDPAQAVREILTAGYGPETVSYAVHLGAYPTEPDRVLLVTQSGGRSPYPGLALNFPSVQVCVRGKPSGYVEARDELRKACNILLGLTETQVSSQDIMRSCNQMGDVMWLGKDDNDRPMFSANFWFIVEPNDAGRRVKIT